MIYCFPCRPRGELCLRGPNVFAGYLKDEKKSKDALEADGWLHTGDIATLTAHGAVSIIDRKKNIFKLAQGEYIAPEKLENYYVKIPLIAQMYVHGDSLQSQLVAVVVPDPEQLLPFAKSRGYSSTGAVSAGGAEEIQLLCQETSIKKQFLKVLLETANKNKLQG